MGYSFFFFTASLCKAQEPNLKAYLEDADLGKKINKKYDKIRAAKIMEESISDESIDFETRKTAFRLWADLTHFARGHADITGKGPDFLQLFQNDREYLSLKAELDYF